jgi:dihydrofolate reductase
MSRLIVSEFVTVDGVMETPEQWVFDYHDEHSIRFKEAEIAEVDTLLLGRHTYDIFAASWPSMTGDFADRMNQIRKYVVTSRPNPDALTWNNSRSIALDVVERIADLRGGPGSGILVAGSGQLVDALASHDMVDEYRLFVCPIIRGGGRRLFAAPSSMALTLIDRQQFPAGAVLVRYAAGDAAGVRETAVESRRAS